MHTREHSYQQVFDALIAPAGLSEAQLDHTLSELMAKGLDAGDVYFQSAYQESWSLEDGAVKDGSFSHDQGVGIRGIAGEKTGFAYIDSLDYVSMLEAVKAARSVAHHAAIVPQKIVTPPHRLDTAAALPVLYHAENPLFSWDVTQKIALLQAIDKKARAYDSRITQVFVSLSGHYERVLVIRHDGYRAADIRPLVRLDISVIAEQNGRKESGRTGSGGRWGYAFFEDPGKIETMVRRACEQALTNLSAIPAPAGTLPVILGGGWGGVLLHEAVGHGLEGDFNRKGTSTYAGKMGQQVASPLCTVIDQGNLPHQRGSLQIDDEGTPTGETVLIEKGILKNYMQDTLNARLMGMAPTGNGRRQSYAHLPMPRMTNTFLQAGDHTLEEMIETVKKGLYVKDFGGGAVDITSGKFVFSASECYLIENGRLGPPVKGATLVGNGPECMQKVVMLGNDWALDDGVGTCGKEGQTVPVGVGQPSLKISEMTIGGTEGGAT